MTAILRFAPSPTGFIHIGNLRTALFNWLYAKSRGGEFVLRFDDTDQERSTRAFADQIEADLAWIGIKPDRVIRQSDRVARYDEAAERLKSLGLLYPCYETPEELDRKRKRLAARGLPPVYVREALRLSQEEKIALEAEGRKPHWRFLLPNHDGDPTITKRTEVHWDDLVRGPQTVDLASLSDPVLIRADGSYLYTLPSIVDDGEVGVTDIIRGDDHVTNTGVQIPIFEALGLSAPRFGHHNLITTIGGEGLSKRTGSLSIKALQDEGYEPMAVASLATLVGLSGSIVAVRELDTLATRVDLGEVSVSASKFDPAELDRLNEEIVHGLAYADVADRLAELDIPDREREAFWLAVRANCGKVREATFWRDVVYGDLVSGDEPDEDDKAFIDIARERLPEGPVDENTWKAWTSDLKKQTGRKGRSLFMPLRLALTGLGHGPELAALLPLIGRERIVARLGG
ncbi:glutamyl-tRNA synthetase [Fulvimarina pelagi HTCC2506]|uniref:Glutamate--tRNA ligase n=2 Tax=Fulvimarina pelagi TaxID=217511 RepID=Q0FY99_9HYPH|nr:glutamate--tRNA ligase [Fulvimarina pelagi]EAU40096.1 glutamyl-tRNA synthetase [Fulvimarina pelagi HTCC2506]BAT31134.1 glutamyl-tRNA synthetase [Fulvimarina pelagi]